MENLNLALHLAETTETGYALLNEMSPAAAFEKSHPGKWSAAEMVGHLIDSASNNHHRFVRASQQKDLIFSGYDQNAWVSLQAYQKGNFPTLIELWSQFNRHLVHVIAHIPDDVLMRLTTNHNFHQIAWQTLPEGQPATLDYFIRDYINHLRHHLNSLFPGTFTFIENPPPGNV